MPFDFIANKRYNNKSKGGLDMKHISKKALLIWEIVSFIVYTILIAFTLLLLPTGEFLRAIILITIICVAILYSVIYLPLYYKSIRYRIDSDSIILQKGVFFHQTQIMQKDKIVFWSVVHDPTTIFFGICTLIVEATGAKLFITGIDIDTAQKIANSLAGKEDSLAK